MKFTMTKEDIAKGNALHHFDCPVALCIKRQLRVKTVMAFHDHVFIEGRWLDAPTKVEFFIQRFDRGEKVKPITFELDYER